MFRISIISGYFLAKREICFDVSTFGGSFFFELHAVSLDLLTLVRFYHCFHRLATFEGSFSFGNLTVIRQKSLKHSWFSDSWWNLFHIVFKQTGAFCVRVKWWLQHRIDQFRWRYIKFILSCEVSGNITKDWASRWLLLFYSPKPRSQLWILVYRKTGMSSWGTRAWRVWELDGQSTKGEGWGNQFELSKWRLNLRRRRAVWSWGMAFLRFVCKNLAISLFVKRTG